MRLLLLALFLPFTCARANGDGGLCEGPSNAVFCAGVLSLKALTPQSRAERMQAAVIDVDLDALRRMKDVYPTEFHASDLLALAAGRYVARDFADVPVARQRAMLAFLIDAVGDMRSPSVARQIGYVASTDRPEAREVIAMLLGRGATARDVDFSYVHNCSSSADVGCKTLALLLEHGLDPARHGRFEQLFVREALMRGHFVDAAALLAHGADPDLSDATSGTSGLVGLLNACPPVRPSSSGTTQDRACWNRTRSAIAFLATHGAHINRGPSKNDPCWTLYDQADVSQDAAAIELLKSLHADPAAGDRCRKLARQ